MTLYKKFDFLGLDILYLIEKKYQEALDREQVQNNFFATEFINKKLAEVQKEIKRRNKKWSI